MLFQSPRCPRSSAPKVTTYGVLIERAESAAGLYAELSSASLYAGAGYHDMAPDQLARYRHATLDAAGGAALERLVAGATFKGLTVGGATSGIPRGVPPSHPRIVLLRHTALVVGARLDASSPDAARDPLGPGTSATQEVTSSSGLKAHEATERWSRRVPMVLASRSGRR